MPERRRPRYNPDERFHLDADPEQVLATLLNPETPTTENPLDGDDDSAPEADDS